MLRAGWKKGEVFSTGLEIMDAPGRNTSAPATSELQGGSAESNKQRYGSGYTWVKKALHYVWSELDASQPALFLVDDMDGKLVLPNEPEMKETLLRHAKFNEEVMGTTWGPTSLKTALALWKAVARSLCMSKDGYVLTDEGTVPC